MKNENGVTLMSLIIYVIVMTIVLAIVVNISASFYDSVNQVNSDSESAVAFSKFNMFFLDDLKNGNTRIRDVYGDYIVLSVDNKDVIYSVQDNSLFRNKIRICKNVESASFVVNSNTINVSMRIGNYEKTTTYIIE